MQEYRIPSLLLHGTRYPLCRECRNKAYFSCRGFPSRSASDSSNSCAAGKSAASEKPSDGLFMKSLTLRGACPLLPVLFMAHELSLTAAEEG